MPELTRRQLLLSLPTAALAGYAFSERFDGAALLAQTATPIRVRTLNHFGIAVADVKRSIEFYQGLFGLPIIARQETTTILRIGGGPQFLAITAVAPGASPSITHYCLGVEGFNVDRLVAALAQHGITKGDAVAPMKVNVTSRDNGTREMAFGDPDGIECQLQDVTYCGGTGPLGSVCKAPEPLPKKGLLALRDMSHLTIFSPDSSRANKFYQDLFGFSVRSYQGPPGVAPTLAVGPTTQFLMFTGGGAPARGGAPAAAPRPASINHACMNMDAFKPDDVLKTLESYGLKPREGAQGPVGPMRHYVTLRMENRGGAKDGTPELYFTDPDGLLMQLQDTSYCGGSGFLGDVCSK
jgi:catechol 2,3-dioxygenase-like lactoylglutathione lyase family enzyme